MRVTLRLLAAVKPGQYLTPGNPTGLCGLFTHPSPRSSLIATYSATLSKLRSLPEHSVYRKSAEAITRHRLSIIESVKPDGYEEWAARASQKINQNPGLFKQLLSGNVGENAWPEEVQAKMNIVKGTEDEEDDRDERMIPYQGNVEDDVAGKEAGDSELDRKLEEEREWTTDVENSIRASLSQEPPTPEEEGAYQEDMEDDIMGGKEEVDWKAVDWEPEPALEARQIMDVENQIGAGLIEEVIQVAEGELQLVSVMAENQVWEELDEKAPAGQWEYFSRDQHTLPTQEPPIEKTS